MQIYGWSRAEQSRGELVVFCWVGLVRFGLVRCDVV